MPIPETSGNVPFLRCATTLDVMASTHTLCMFTLRSDDHSRTVPLAWANPGDGRTIDIHASVVTREGGETLPYLVFLQGGPGNEAPRALAARLSPPWLEAALEEYRVV